MSQYTVYKITNDLNNDIIVGSCNYPLPYRLWWCNEYGGDDKPEYREMRRVGVSHYLIHELELCRRTDHWERERVWREDLTGTR